MLVESFSGREKLFKTYNDKKIISYNKSKYILQFIFKTVVNIPIKVLTNFSEWFTWTELKEALTKAKETLDLVHLARDRFVKLCFWECFRVLYVVFFFFAF